MYFVLSSESAFFVACFAFFVPFCTICCRNGTPFVYFPVKIIIIIILILLLLIIIIIIIIITILLLLIIIEIITVITLSIPTLTNITKKHQASDEMSATKYLS